ncbi:hypothetical protein GUJ93_ZPchr0005g14724 [Zizania palustris]|uniref:Uncharacterized protein n=1 Tax=Zizania palustris TaxID=103762 RepID=A0A8J5STG6_ZIZPA|nr:hypothetical protein GUJ93_ZPchr0005g14724 [Zizania palustris]
MQTPSAMDHLLLDSASEISRLVLSPATSTTLPSAASAAARFLAAVDPLIRIFGLRRGRGASSAAASPRSCRRTLPHELQEAYSPSVLRRRAAPQWLHQHNASTVIA